MASLIELLLMIRGRAMKGGSTYCAEHLQANDYYEKGRKIEGVWIGSACESVGVEQGSKVLPEVFDWLRLNRHASDGEPVQITARLHWSNSLDEAVMKMSTLQLGRELTLTEAQLISGFLRTFSAKRLEFGAPEAVSAVGSAAGGKGLEYQF